MNIKRNENRRKVIITCTLLVLLFLFIFTGLTYAKSWWPFNDVDSTAVIELVKEDNSNVAGQGYQNNVKGDQIAEEPTETVGGDATLTITQLEQVDNSILLRASLKGVAEGGRCIAYFSSAGGDIAKYATLTNDNGSLTCLLDSSAFDFSYLGEWTVRLVYSTPDNKKIETTGDIIIR